MKTMSMRERLMAVLEGRQPDRVPLIMYQDLLPKEQAEVDARFGDKIGMLKWSAVHKLVTPHCRTVVEEYYDGETRCERSTLYTPAGSLYQIRAYEPTFNSGAFRKHYVEEPRDYEILWAYLEDGTVIDDFDRYHADQAELGERGLPLPAVERSPFQQLWVEWVDLDVLSYHYADCPERVEKTIAMLTARERQIFEIVRRSPAVLIDFPDNITAPVIGLKRFMKYNVPLYNELGEMLAERNVPVFVHMDGDLQPLWQAIADSKVGGLDSFSPTPDNDTSVEDALALWPEKRLFINFPSSVHLRSYDEVRAEAEHILNAGGHTGRLEIQFSENVPYYAWRNSFQAITDAVDAFRP